MTRLSASLLTIVLVAALTIAVGLVALPRFIMAQVMAMTVGHAGGVNRAAVQPPIDATSRSIVLPSPDLLYTICVYDLSRGPVTVEAPLPESYGSVSVFQSNSDNVFVINDRDAPGRLARVLIAPASWTGTVPEGFALARSESARGVVLVRTLIDSDANLAALQALQKQVNCGEMR